MANAIRSIVVTIISTFIIIVIAATYAAAADYAKVDLGYNNMLEVERLDEAGPDGQIYVICITINDKDIREGILVSGIVDVSSGTIPQMFLKRLDVTTGNGHAYIYGFQQPEDIASIVEWLNSTNHNKHQELTFIVGGDFAHYPVKVKDPKKGAEEIAKLLLCIS